MERLSNRLRPRITAVVLLLLNSSIVPAQRSNGPAQPGGRQIGIVVVEGAPPGQPVSASVVTDLDRLRNVPGLKVVTVPIDSSVSLEKLVVNTGDGKLQPAGEPLLATVPVDGPELRFRISRTDRPDEPVATALIPIDTLSEPAPTQFMAPAIANNGVLEVVGPIGGDTVRMHASEDNLPVRILASRPGAVFIDTLASATPGAHTIKMDDATGAELFTLPDYTVQATTPHPARRLHPGQTAHVSFVLSGPESLPESSWGSVEFHLINETPEIAELMGPQDFVFDRGDFLGGPKTVTVTLLALHGGDSLLRSQLRVKLHPVAANGRRSNQSGVILQEPMPEEQVR